MQRIFNAIRQFAYSIALQVSDALEPPFNRFRRRVIAIDRRQREEARSGPVVLVVYEARDANSLLQNTAQLDHSVN